MKRTVKILALLMALAMVFGMLAGCGGGSKTPDAAPSGDEGKKDEAPADSGLNVRDVTEDQAKEDVTKDEDTNETRTLNISLSDDCGTLNPMASQGSFVSVTYAFYEPLWDYLPSGERVWLLATSYEPVNETQYKLTLREGVKFANGNDFTAEDVLFTMKLCAEDPRFYLNVKAIDLEKTCVTGKYTMDVYYTNYDVTQEPNMLQMLIYDEESYDPEYMSNHTIGTGKYIVTDYVVNSHITAERNENYWGDKANIKTINFKVIGEAAQIINAIETGDIDVASVVSVADADYVKSLGYTLDTRWGGYCNTAYLSFHGALASKDARWAVAYAFDRESMNLAMYNGLSTYPDHPVSDHMIDFQEGFRDLTDYYVEGYNLEKAKEYAEKSGLVGQTLKIITNGNETYNDAAQILKNSLHQIGVEATITPLDQATYFSSLMDASGFDIGFYFVSSPSMLASDVIANYPDFVPLDWTGPEHDEFSEIAHACVHEFDEAKRAELLSEAMVKFADACMWVPVNESLALRGWDSDVANVVYMLAGNCDYGQITFK
ncbi:MAG: ABC transporter substrate-binding protein [Oscillospiraceae bacterium]|nr:ABC transporter substrate-binding protein [Oscillospiraceae bacterium]